MEITYTLPQNDVFSSSVQQEQTIEKILDNKLREMSNIIINHQSKIKVLKCVKFTLETNSDIIDVIPSLVIARETFIKKENELFEFYKINKKYFLNIILRIAEALREYGVMTDNSDVIERGKITSEHLLKLSEKELISRGYSIFNYSRSYFQSLSQIANLKTILSEIKDQSSIFTDDFYNDNFSLTDIYNKIFNDLKEFLFNTIDNLVNELKDAYPRFYIEYKSARLAGSLDTLKENSDLAWIM